MFWAASLVVVLSDVDRMLWRAIPLQKLCGLELSSHPSPGGPALRSGLLKGSLPSRCSRGGPAWVGIRVEREKVKPWEAVRSTCSYVSGSASRPGRQTAAIMCDFYKAVVLCG